MKTCKFSNLFATIVAVLLMWGCSSEVPTEPVSPEIDAVKSAELFSIAGEVFLGDPIDYGDWWETPSGVTHMSGYTFPVEFTGDLAAETIFVQSGHWNSQGNGSVNGVVEVDDANLIGVIGSLNGQFAGNLHFWWLEGTFVLQGSSGLDGYHVQIHMTGPLGGPLDYTGDVVVDASN